VSVYTHACVRKLCTHNAQHTCTRARVRNTCDNTWEKIYGVILDKKISIIKIYENGAFVSKL